MTPSERLVLQPGPLAGRRPRAWSADRLRRLAARATVYAVLILVGVTMVVPFLAMLSQSLKNTGEFFTYPFEWIPTQPTLMNYGLLFSSSGIVRWTANSFLIAGGVALLQLLTCSLAAYAFAR